MVASKYVTPSPMGGIDVHLPLPQETTSVFASLPEWIVDDIADFLLFALQYFPLGTYTTQYLKNGSKMKLQMFHISTQIYITFIYLFLQSWSNIWTKI